METETTEWADLLSSPGAQPPMAHEIDPAFPEALQHLPAAIVVGIILIIGVKAWQNLQNKD